MKPTNKNRSGRPKPVCIQVGDLFSRYSVILIVFSLIITHVHPPHVHGVTRECKVAIRALAGKGPGSGWIYVDHLHELIERRSDLKEVTAGNLYECPHCDLLQPSHNIRGEQNSCGGCGKHFDTSIPVHNVTDSNGRPIVLLKSIILDGRHVGRTVRPPIKCAYCGETNRHSAKTCKTCGASVSEGSVKVARFGENRVVRMNAERIEGYEAMPYSHHSRDAHSLERTDGYRPPGSRSRGGFFDPNEFKKTKWTLGILAVLGGLGGGTYWYLNQPITIEAPTLYNGTIESGDWEREISVFSVERLIGEGFKDEIPVGAEILEDSCVKRDRVFKDGTKKSVLYCKYEYTKWHPILDNSEKPKIYRTSGKIGTEVVWDPSLPEEYRRNTRDFRTTWKQKFSIKIKYHGTSYTWHPGKTDFENWREDERVQVKAFDSGSVVGIRHRDKFGIEE